MSTEQSLTTPVARGGRRTGKLTGAAVLAVVALTLVGGLVFFSFARDPVAVGNFVIVGPECEAQPATRVEGSYQRAKQRSDGSKPSLIEFAGIRFYQNVPWGAAEQNAPVGAQ